MDRDEKRRLDFVGQNALFVVWIGGGLLGSWAIGWSPPLGVIGMWFLAMFVGAAVQRYITGSWHV